MDVKLLYKRDHLQSVVTQPLCDVSCCGGGGGGGGGVVTGFHS